MLQRLTILFLPIPEAPPQIILPSVLIPPIISESPSSPGDSMTLHCVLQGCPVPEVEWVHNDAVLEVVDDRITTEVTKSHGLVIGYLTISSLTESDSGSYYCHGTSSAGNISTDSANLVVASSLRKRSVEDDPMESFPCSTSPTDENGRYSICCLDTFYQILLS